MDKNTLRPCMPFQWVIEIIIFNWLLTSQLVEARSIFSDFDTINYSNKNSVQKSCKLRAKIQIKIFLRS